MSYKTSSMSIDRVSNEVSRTSWMKMTGGHPVLCRISRTSRRAFRVRSSFLFVLFWDSTQHVVEIFLFVTPDCSLRLLGVRKRRKVLYTNGFGSYSFKKQKAKVELPGVLSGYLVERWGDFPFPDSVFTRYRDVSLRKKTGFRGFLYSHPRNPENNREGMDP